MKKTIKLEGAAKRLDDFITSTSMNYSEFSRQCGLKHPKNILAVCRQGQQPTGKLMDKIIFRFPQLNYDWVMLGYGEMIVPGMQNQPTNANSLKKSMNASYENIKEYLENHDYAINYLANKIEKALLSSVKTFHQVNDRLNVFEDNLKHLKDNQVKFIDSLNINTEKSINNITDKINKFENDFKIVANKHLTIVDDLDKKRMNFIDSKIDVLIKEIEKARADHLKLTDDLDKKRLNYLNESFETIKKDLIDTSNSNTKKAIDFLNSIKKSADLKADNVLGEFKKHTNPKPQK